MQGACGMRAWQVHPGASYVLLLQAWRQARQAAAHATAAGLAATSVGAAQ